MPTAPQQPGRTQDPPSCARPPQSSPGRTLPADGWFRLRRALGTRRGATALEFALAGSCFLLITLGCVEAAWQAATRAAVDYAALRVSRIGTTGVGSVAGAPSGASCRNEAMMKYLVARATGNFLRNDGRLSVSMASYSGYGALQSGGAGTAGAGAPGDTVRYTITYRQPWLIPSVVKLTRMAGTDHLQHTAMVLAKNEPFANAAGC